MKKSNIFNSPRLLGFRKEKRRILIKKIIFRTFVVFLFLIGLSFLSKWQKINIDSINIIGNKVIEVKEIENVIKENINGNYFWFFPKANFLLYPKKTIEEELFQRFKRIDAMSLNVINFKTLEVSLSERIALYTWCGVTPYRPNEEKERCYFLDENGFIFDEAPYFSGEVYLKFYGGVGVNEGSPSGLYFIEPNFKRLIALREMVEDGGIKPAVFYIEDSGDVRIFLSSLYKSRMGPEIILKMESDFNKIVENLQSVLATEPLRKDFKDKIASLLYIDLRFGNKVYYKYQ